MRVERVVIETLRENTFYATISVATAGESREVDARPSDALNLAVRVGAPVFVATDVMETSGVGGDVQLHSRLSAAETPVRNGGDRLGDWRSLTADVLWSLYPASSAEPILERFTEGARSALVLAQQEAHSLGHPHIRLDHLLLGLLREPDGVAARVLLSTEHILLGLLRVDRDLLRDFGIDARRAAEDVQTELADRHARRVTPGEDERG